MKHVLYTDEDEDYPDVICDRNGQVALAMCKNCHRAEVELLNTPECDAEIKGESNAEC